MSHVTGCGYNFSGGDSYSRGGWIVRPTICKKFKKGMLKTFCNGSKFSICFEMILCVGNGGIKQVI